MSRHHDGSRTVNRRFFRIEAANLFGMVLLPLLLLGVAVCILNTHAMNRETDDSYRSRINYISEHISSLTQDIERLTYSLTTSPAVTVRLKAAMQHVPQGGVQIGEYATYNAVLDLVYASCGRNPYIDSVYIYFEDGEDFFISSGKRLTHLREAKDTAWHDAYLHQDPFVNKWSEIRRITRDDGGTEEVLTVYSRIFAGGTGSDRGVLVMNIDCAAVDALLSQLDEGRAYAICVLDEQANVLFSNTVFGRLYGSSVPAYYTPGARAGEEVYTVRWNGRAYRCTDRALSAYGWRIAAFTDQGILYETSARMLFILAAMLGLTILFGIVFAYRVARQNSLDVAHVERALQLAREGAPYEETPAESSPYGETMTSVIRSFLDEDYQRVRSADRRHHMKLLELQALQAQLNPHFLFNTMMTIQWKAIGLTGGSNAASDMLENLSDILHYVLDNGVRPARLGEELMITDSYVAIQQIRYADTFRYSCVCDEHLFDLRVMRMLLQPLVENSISHGMHSDGAVLHVSVRIREHRGMLEIAVEDDGVGMDPARLQQVRDNLDRPRTEDGRHIGLYNVNKRIALTYGEAYRIQIDSREGVGTTISIRVPIEDAQPAGTSAAPAEE